MLTSTALGYILTLQLLLSFTAINIAALPITSKPIEGTAEHLAWQAWLMLPPDQKNLEKSRKVTPKSIFTLPNRDCPDGHQLYENRCIPTVNIDPTELLKQQLQFVVDSGNNDGDNKYELDYSDIGTDVIVDISFGSAEKLSTDNANKGTFHLYDQLPSQDEPLKFNLFQQKFPTDYETESMPSDETDDIINKTPNTQLNATIPNNEQIPAMEVMFGAAIIAKNESQTISVDKNNNTKNSNNTIDEHMESSNISMSIAALNTNRNNNSKKNSDEIVTPSTAFSISDIDAIALSAVPPTPQHHSSADPNSNNLELNEQKLHRVSLFKDDSSVQLITSSLLTERGNEPQNQPNLKQLLKAEDLLPLPNIAAQQRNSSSASINVGSSSTTVKRKTTTTTTTATTATPSTTATSVPRTSSTTMRSDNEVSTLSKGSNATNPLRDNINADDDEFAEASDVILSTQAEGETTLLPSLFDDIVDGNEKVVTPAGSGYESLTKKSIKDHPRSVLTMKNAASNMTEAQEDKFTTTTEPDVPTTNFQVDETTVVEMHDAPTIALKELLELAQHPSVGTHENLGAVVKKSKVEPVELPPIELDDAETDSRVITTTTSTTKTSASSPTVVATKTAELSMPSTTELPGAEVTAAEIAAAAASTMSSIKLDRFVNQQSLNTNSNNNNNNINKASKSSDVSIRNDDIEPLNDGNLSYNERAPTTSTTKQASEIDIKQELRMINELVKGNRNRNSDSNNKQRRQEIKGAITTSPTESGLATNFRKSTEAYSHSNKNDNIGGSLMRESTTKKKDESRTTTAMMTTLRSTSTTSLPFPSSSSSTTPAEQTSVIWSKIMPLLGFATSFGETLTETTETIPSEISSMIISASPTTPSSTGKTPTIPAKNNEIVSINDVVESSINRSNKNSKIIQINSLSTPSLSSNSNSDSISNSLSNILSSSINADKLVPSTTDPSTLASSTKTTTTATTATKTTTATSTDYFDSSISSSIIDSDPFWWLPLGWRLDRPKDNDEADESFLDSSFLLPFWSEYNSESGDTSVLK